MLTKVMKIFYNENNFPFKDVERKVAYPLLGNAFMGASNTTEVRFYVKDIGGIDATWVCISKLPNGKTGCKVMQTAHDSELNEDYAYLTLDTFYTQAKGDLYLTLAGYDSGIELTYNSDTQLYEINGTPTIQATGSVKLNIAYATQVSGNEQIETITLQQILALVGDKLNKNSPNYIKKVSSIDNINTATYEEYLQADDLVVDLATYKLYKLSGEYPTLVATEISDLDDIGYTTLTSVANGHHFDNSANLLKNLSFAFYNGQLYTRISSGATMTFASEWQIYDDTTHLSIGRVVFNVNPITAIIYNSQVESYEIYSKANSDSKFVDFTTDQTISGKKTFTKLPQSSVVPTNDDDLVNRKFITTNYYDKTTIDYLLVNIDDLANYYTKEETNSLLNAKQDKLVSGTNIKTIAGKTIVGSGNVSLNKGDVGLNNLSNDLQVKASERGVANGVATLDSNAKVPIAQLPDSILGQLLFGGTFKASNGLATLTINAQEKLGTSSATITLTNDTSAITGYVANNGIFYIATDSGTFAGISFIVGDWLISTGNGWEKVDNTDAVSSVNGKTGAVVLTKADIGLGNVDNTSDLDKPVSTATQTALDYKADKSTTYTKTETDNLLSNKQDKLPNVVNNRFLHTNNSGNYEWTSLINTISGTSISLSQSDFNELVEEHIFAINNVSLPYLTNSTYDLNYITIQLGSETKQFLFVRNSATEYVGSFDLLDDTLLYQINVFYDGTDIYLKCSSYNVIPNNALVDNGGNAIVDINGNYLVVS